MSAAARAQPKRNLLLAFDAFGTLFTPREPIAAQYSEAAASLGVKTRGRLIEGSFRQAYKDQSAKYPNYGKAVGMGVEAWWANVIENTLRRNLILAPSVQISRRTYLEEITQILLKRFSTKEGYTIYPDVMPLFDVLRQIKACNISDRQNWPWDTTVVGVITNSDDRVPGVLRSFGLNVGARVVGRSHERLKAATVDDDISFVVLSYDVGHEKPAKEIFEAADELLRETLADPNGGMTGYEPDTFHKVYVGDEPQKDYVGAKRAGWDAICIDRTNCFGGYRTQGDLDTQRMIAKVPLSDVDVYDGEFMDVIWDLRALKHWHPSK